MLPGRGRQPPGSDVNLEVSAPTMRKSSQMQDLETEICGIAAVAPSTALQLARRGHINTSGPWIRLYSK